MRLEERAHYVDFDTYVRFDTRFAKIMLGILAGAALVLVWYWGFSSAPGSGRGWTVFMLSNTFSAAIFVWHHLDRRAQRLRNPQKYADPRDLRPENFGYQDHGRQTDQISDDFWDIVNRPVREKDMPTE